MGLLLQQQVQDLAFPFVEFSEISVGAHFSSLVEITNSTTSNKTDL